MGLPHHVLPSVVGVIAMLALSVLQSQAHRRGGVIQIGTTEDPNFVRVQGVNIHPCPKTHPTAFDKGLKCCAEKFRINDTATIGCDGRSLALSDPSLCCAPGNSVPCQYSVCKDGAVDGVWLSWSDWTACGCQQSRSTSRFRQCQTPKFGGIAFCPHQGTAMETKACCPYLKSDWTASDSGGSASIGFVIDDIISNDLSSLWHTSSASGYEWMQVDFRHTETVIGVEIVDRQLPAFNSFRSAEVRIGHQMVGGTGLQDLSNSMNAICGHLPDDSAPTTTVHEIVCSPGPIQGGYLTMQRNAPQNWIWFLNEISIVTPFYSGEEYQIATTGNGIPPKTVWTATGTPSAYGHPPAHAIDGNSGALFNYFSATQCASLGWGWIQVDFQNEVKVMAVAWKTRSPLAYLDLVNRAFGIDFRIGNFYNRLGLRTLTSNTLCGTLAAPTGSSDHYIICSPVSIRGRFLTAQRTIPGDWDIVELDVITP